VQTQTFPNRLYLLAGTSFGVIRNDIFSPLPAATHRSVFNLLDEHAVTWRIYASQYPSAYATTFFQYVADHGARVAPIAQYYTDLANGTLPNVSFIDPDFAGKPREENDEHPISNVQVGQKFVADAVNGLLGSSAWASSALFLTWDEHGGFYDHVTPPAAPVPDATPPDWALGDPHEFFDEYGVRVPVVAVSPYSKSNFVSHVVHDHTSILKFIETRFGLPSLTNRDGLADPMMELFDFNTATFATPPSLPAAVVDPVKLAACPN
jgi:phospholipase C